MFYEVENVYMFFGMKKKCEIFKKLNILFKKVNNGDENEI
jgi:hypothetical protein